MTADEQLLRITAVGGDIAPDPIDGTNAVIDGSGKHMLWRQPVASGHERHTGVVECRRHEQHPFLVAGRPPATMPEQQHASIGAGCADDCDALIGIDTECKFLDCNARRSAPALRAVHLAGLRQRFLRRIVVELHRVSSASSTRSGVIGSIVNRTPVAARMALAMAGAAPTSEGSPMPLAPSGCDGSGSS